MVTVELLSDLARRAGAITLQHYQSGLAIETKADESPVTVADRQTEQFLRAEIGRLFPGDGIVGEEFGSTEGTTGRKWIVDPIDGTKSFIHGVPFYGVMIGVEQDGAMLAGAVYIPPLGEMVAAVKGAGCWWNGRRARVTATERIEDALLLTPTSPTTTSTAVVRPGRRCRAGPASSARGATATATSSWPPAAPTSCSTPS